MFQKTFQPDPINNNWKCVTTIENTYTICNNRFDFVWFSNQIGMVWNLHTCVTYCIVSYFIYYVCHGVSFLFVQKKLDTWEAAAADACTTSKCETIFQFTLSHSRLMPELISNQFSCLCELLGHCHHYYGQSHSDLLATTIVACRIEFIRTTRIRSCYILGKVPSCVL